MGTRHLIAVQVDGEYKISQYGQWDGYPSGQGVEVLAFARDMDRDAFADKCRKAIYLSEDQLEEAWVKAGAPKGAESVSMQISDQHKSMFPHLSRDCGSDVLGIVNNSPDGIGLKNSIEFAGDSLFCEFAYVLDLDVGTLEVFKGFNKKKLNPAERFANSKTDHAEYQPVAFWAAWPLYDLPTEEEFIKQLEDDEDDEEDD